MKTKVPYEITSNAIKGYDESTIAKEERNDCVVRAFASSFDIPYDKAWKIISEKFGRKPRQGTYSTYSTLNKLSEVRYTCNYKKIKPIGKTRGDLRYDVKVKGEVVKRKMTVGTFIKKNPEGTFFILVRGHAFTIKNGVVIGNYEDSIKLKKEIYFAYQII
jgi:hypothetical protein